MGYAKQRPGAGARMTGALLFQFLVAFTALLSGSCAYAQGSGALPEGVDHLNPKFHTMISTDCSVYSDWQAEVLAYSHFKSGTTGKLTRIASCQHSNYTYPKIWHPEMQLETTPYFGEQTLPTRGVDKYPIYNKPFGINHWLTQGAGSSLLDDTVVVMLDPDMIIQMPLQHAFERNLTGEPVVSAGRPAAQSWSLGYSWYSKWNAEEWLKEECKAAGPGSCRMADRDRRILSRHYMVGAPHAMTAGDWRALCPLWGRYLLRIRDVDKGWMADMNAFILAAMQLGLRHETTNSLQVWMPEGRTLEAWHLVSGLDDETGSSQTAASSGSRFEPNFAYDGKTAPILHYCRTAQLRERTDIGSHDRFSKYGFGKKPAGAADCSPQPAYRYNNKRLLEIEKDPQETLKARRHAYLMRNVAKGVWEGLAHYRETVCDIKAGSAYAALPWNEELLHPEPQQAVGFQQQRSQGHREEPVKVAEGRGGKLPSLRRAEKLGWRRSPGLGTPLVNLPGRGQGQQALLKRIERLGANNNKARRGPTKTY